MRGNRRALFIVVGRRRNNAGRNHIGASRARLTEERQDEQRRKIQRPEAAERPTMRSGSGIGGTTKGARCLRLFRADDGAGDFGPGEESSQSETRQG